MKLSFIIPCYHEAKTIRAIIESVRAASIADPRWRRADSVPEDELAVYLPVRGR